jgi:ribulose-phosphate 3-epimerase
MSVNPGFGGQEFIPQMIEKIIQLKEILKSKNPEVLIEVDGGINENNAHDVISAGADILVAGSAIFNSPNPEKTIKELKIKAN